MSVSKHGKWNCFSDPSPEHRQAVCRWLNARLREDSPDSFSGDERWAEKKYQKSLQWRQLMSRVEELNYLLWNSVDPDFGITEEMFWKEFIGCAVRIGIEPSRAVTAAEERVHKKCPTGVKP